MKFWIKFLVSIALILLLLILGARYALDALIGGNTEPMVGRVTRYPSPDLKLVATLEEVDNGLGFGQGMLYDEVHLQLTNEKILGHGDSDSSAIFYADSMGKQNTLAPRLHLVDATHLAVEYDSSRIESTRPGKIVRHLRGIEIVYQNNSSQ